jgi:phage-related protein
MDSLEKVLRTLKDARKIGVMKRGLAMQLDKLAKGEKLSTENFAPEGNLPSGKKFFALKKLPIRGYCWFSQSNKGVVYISHYVHKKTQKLSEADINKVASNWKRIEEQGYEY